MSDLAPITHPLLTAAGIAVETRPDEWDTPETGRFARIVNGGVGSRRYRVAFKGPGGHSYGAFGIVNPMAAMAGAMPRVLAGNGRSTLIILAISLLLQRKEQVASAPPMNSSSIPLIN